MLIYQHNGTSLFISARVSYHPYGVFSSAEPIYKCPEREDDPTGKVFTYNAKAHPHLSEEGSLLISYNVNTFNDTGEFIENGEIYHPRFIKLMFTLREEASVTTPEDIDEFLASNPLENATVSIDEQGRRVWKVDSSYFGDETDSPAEEDEACLEPDVEEDETSNLIESEETSQKKEGGSSGICFISSLAASQKFLFFNTPG